MSSIVTTSTPRSENCAFAAARIRAVQGRHGGDLAMSSTTNSAKGSSAILWTGRVLSGVVVLFFLMDAGMKLADVEPVREAQQQLGWPLALVRVIGLIDLLCLALYLV